MAAQYDFIAGLDISSLSSVTQAQLMQMINQISPISNIGGVIFQAGPSVAAEISAGFGGAPDVTNNPRFARYIWLNTYDGIDNAPTPYYYNDANGNWTSTSVASGSITNASINAAAAIDVTKLAPSSNNRWILRTNDNHSAVEYKAPSGIFTNGELPVVTLTPNPSKAYLKTNINSGPAEWVSEATERTNIQNGISNLAVNQLASGASGQLLYTSPTGPAWNSPSSIFGLGSNIPLTALSGTNAGLNHVIRYTGANWVTSQVGLLVFADSAISTVGVIANTNKTGAEVTGGSFNLTNLVYRVSHGFNVVPKVVRVVAYCFDPAGDPAIDTECVQGTEIPVENIVEGTGKGQNYTVAVTSQFIYVSAFIGTQGNVLVTPLVGGAARAPMSVTRWRIKVYAWI